MADNANPKDAPSGSSGDKSHEVAGEIAARVVDEIFDKIWSQKEELLTLRMSQLEEGEGEGLDLRAAVEEEGEAEELDEETKEEREKKAVAFAEALNSVIPRSALQTLLAPGTKPTPDQRGALAMSVMPSSGLSPGFLAPQSQPQSILAQSVDVLVCC